MRAARQPARLMPLVGALLAVGSALSANAAKADVQASVRYGLGFGGTVAEEQGPRLLVETTLRSELLFGAAGDEHVRIGPAVDLRTNRFDSFEAAAGAAILLPAWRGFPFVVTAGAGYAWRQDPDPNGAFFLGTLAWGYRSYNFHGRYGLGLNVYVSTRIGLDHTRYEVTAGIEIDLEALLVIPVAFFVSLARRGPPDEPETDAD